MKKEKKTKNSELFKEADKKAVDKMLEGVEKREKDENNKSKSD